MPLLMMGKSLENQKMKKGEKHSAKQSQIGGRRNKQQPGVDYRKCPTE